MDRDFPDTREYSGLSSVSILHKHFEVKHADDFALGITITLSIRLPDLS